MRKIYSILLAAFALSAVSCQEEIVDPTVELPVKEVMTITAGFDTETKTVLHTNGVSSLWHENDKVSVFDTKVGDNNRCFSIVKEEGDEFPKATATFATAEEFAMPGDQTQDQALIVALYPYQETAYCDFFDPQDGVNDITGITIPVEQVAVADGFDASAAFALATGKYTERDNLRFKNLYSLLKINVLEEGIKKIEVVLETEGFIAGEAQIVLTPGVDENERPVFNGGVLTATGSKSVTLTCEAGFEVGKIYSVAIAPVTYTNVKVYLDDQLAKDTTPATAKTLEPNTFYNIRNLKKLATRGLAFDEATYNVSLGNDFKAPELKGDKEGVVYASSNEEVATVDAETGEVTIVAVGETTITASADATATLLAGEATYTLTVNKADRTISFAQSSVEVTYGDPFTGQTLADVTGVTYEVTGDAATVNPATGAVTIVKAGTVTIKATVAETDTHNAATAEYTLTVNKAERTNKVKFDKESMEVTYGADATFAEPKLTNLLDGDVVSYTITKGSDVVDVVAASGNITAKKAGTATIQATVESDKYVTVTASYNLTVNLLLTFEIEMKWTQLNLHLWVENGDNDLTLTGDWPGQKLTKNPNTGKYEYEIPAEYANKKIGYILSNNGQNQTADDYVTLNDTKTSVTRNYDFYLKPNDWKSDNAWFAIYCWKTGGDAWAKMDKISDNLYGVILPNGYTLGCAMKFVRMANNNSDLGWGSKWNETDNLVSPTNINNVFTINGWSYGSWSSTK